MSTDYSPRSSGGPRRGRRRTGGRRPNGSRSEYPVRRDKKPTGFVAKIQLFFKNLFGGKKTTKTSSQTGGPRSKPEATSGTTRPQNSPPKSALEEPNLDLVTGPRLYVGNLSYDTAESDLFDLFSKVGAVRNVELVMDRRANRSKGFGFVEMTDIEVAKQAVLKIHRMEFMGRQIVVSGAKSERRETESRQEETAI